MTDEKYREFPIITLCGSTKFKKEYELVMMELTLQGKCVISVGCFGHSDINYNEINNLKPMLDRMHLQKIDMAYAIYVIDVDGYIGDSTRKEIEYAKDHGKKVYYYSKGGGEG